MSHADFGTPDRLASSSISMAVTFDERSTGSARSLADSQGPKGETPASCRDHLEAHGVLTGDGSTR